MNPLPPKRRVKRCWILVRPGRCNPKAAETLTLTVKGVPLTPVFTTEAKCRDFAKAVVYGGIDLSLYKVFETTGLVCRPLIDPDLQEVLARSTVDRAMGAPGMRR